MALDDPTVRQAMSHPKPPPPPPRRCLNDLLILYPFVWTKDDGKEMWQALYDHYGHDLLEKLFRWWKDKNKDEPKMPRLFNSKASEMLIRYKEDEQREKEEQDDA